MTDPVNNLRLSNLNLSNGASESGVDDLWEKLTSTGTLYPPLLVSVDGQNILIKEHGGSLLRILRTNAPRWYQVASDAFIAMYAWHGTTDARPMHKKLASTLIRQSMESLAVTDPTQCLETVSLNIGNAWCTTSVDNSGFMDHLHTAIASAQDVFYERTTAAVRYLVLPCNIAPWEHPGVIPSERPATGEQVDYVVSLVSWSPFTGYNLWHEFRPDGRGGTEVCWFERHSLKNLMDSMHFTVENPGYLFIQEQYANPDTGADDWGPLSMVTFHSTTWILATIHVYLWADILGRKKYSTDHFTNNRRDAIIDQQHKIQIILKKILRRRVPGLSPAQNDVAYHALHRFMNTNPNLPFPV